MNTLINKVAKKANALYLNLKIIVSTHGGLILQ